VTKGTVSRERIQREFEPQSTYSIYPEYVLQCLFPCRNWDSPHPLPPRECAPPLEPGGGARSPAGEWEGKSQFGRLEKKLSTLPTLWLTLKICRFRLDKGQGSFLNCSKTPSTLSEKIEIPFRVNAKSTSMTYCLSTVSNHRRNVIIQCCHSDCVSRWGGGWGCKLQLQKVGSYLLILFQCCIMRRGNLIQSAWKRH